MFKINVKDNLLMFHSFQHYSTVVIDENARTFRLSQKITNVCD